MPNVPVAIDRFTIQQVLGKGGMGTVYLARDERLDRLVALKVLNSEEILTDEARNRFLREARTAAAIRHPNVATIHEVGETSSGDPFIVMEYCDGETLGQRLRREALTTSQFLQIATQIAAGLAAAQENGVVHRDLKAANIMIERNGTAKILDFGLAKLHPREIGARSEKASYASTSGQFFGTLHYLAPEQTRGATADERSDLFAVGVVLYQMATGRLPFNADGPLLVLEKIRDAEPEPFQPVDPTLPPEIARIISKLLQKNPASRYQQAAELLADLQQVETAEAPTIGHKTRSMFRSTRRRTRGRNLGVASLALVFLIAAILLVRRGILEETNNGTAANRPQPIRSMAVLPLSNIARHEKDDFLSIGLADALVTKLQAIPSLHVRPTSAVMEFQDQAVDARTASEKLQVDGILEGHFLTTGDRVRVNMQLTDSRSGYSVWADSIEGRRDNLLQLMDEVSQRTVTGLHRTLQLPESPRGFSEPRSRNPQAYEEYLRARSLSGSFVASEYQEQLQALRRAIELDPEFAAAYAELAIALSLGHARSMVDQPEAMREAEGYARRAVRLDPNLPQAHLALGRVFVRDPDRFRESAREILAALRLNANDPHALHSVTTYFVSTGDLQKAACVGDLLVQIDPSSNEAKSRGYWYVNAVDAEGALTNAKWALESKDTAVAGHDIRGVAYILQGNLIAAEREAEALTGIVPRHYLGRSLAGMISAARGDRETALRHAQSFVADANRNHWAALRQALIYARLDEKEKAVAWIERAAQQGHHSWYTLVKHPWLQSLQGEPRFAAVVSRIKADLDDVRDDMIGVQQLICR